MRSRSRRNRQHRAAAATAADTDVPLDRRARDDGRDRPRFQERSVHGRPEADRLRSLRRRRQAGTRLDGADPRRPRVQHAGAAASAAPGRDHSAGRAADQRRGRPRVPALRRRPPHGLPNTPRIRDLPQDAEEPDPRRRHVRHRLDRHFVDLVQLTYDRAGARRAIKRITGDGLKPTEIIEGTEGVDGPERTAPSRPRRVLDRLRPDDRTWRRCTTAARR